MTLSDFTTLLVNRINTIATIAQQELSNATQITQQEAQDILHKNEQVVNEYQGWLSATQNLLGSGGPVRYDIQQNTYQNVGLSLSFLAGAFINPIVGIIGAFLSLFGFGSEKTVIYPSTPPKEWVNFELLRWDYKTLKDNLGPPDGNYLNDIKRFYSNWIMYLSTQQGVTDMKNRNTVRYQYSFTPNQKAIGQTTGTINYYDQTVQDGNVVFPYVDEIGIANTIPQQFWDGDGNNGPWFYATKTFAAHTWWTKGCNWAIFSQHQLDTIEKLKEKGIL